MSVDERKEKNGEKKKDFQNFIRQRAERKSNEMIQKHCFK